MLRARPRIHWCSRLSQLQVAEHLENLRFHRLGAERRKYARGFLRDARPQRFIRKQPERGGGKFFGAVREQAVAFALETESFGGDPGQHDRQRIGQRLADFAFDARSESQRRDEDPAVAEILAHVLDVAGH